MNTASDPFTVMYRGSFEQWAFAKNTDLSSSARLGDEDGDGIPKLLEYGFNLDPARSERVTYDPVTSPATGLPRVFLKPEAGGSRLCIQYLRRKNVTGLSYAPQFGSTLDDFTSGSGPVTVESVGADWELVTAPDTVASGPGKRFGRVKVVLTP